MNTMATEGMIHRSIARMFPMYCSAHTSENENGEFEIAIMHSMKGHPIITHLTKQHRSLSSNDIDFMLARLLRVRA